MIYALALDEHNRAECPHWHGGREVLVSGNKGRCDSCGRVYLVQDMVRGAERWAIVKVKAPKSMGTMYRGDWP